MQHPTNPNPNSNSNPLLRLCFRDRSGGWSHVPVHSRGLIGDTGGLGRGGGGVGNLIVSSGKGHFPPQPPQPSSSIVSHLCRFIFENGKGGKTIWEKHLVHFYAKCPGAQATIEGL